MIAAALPSRCWCGRTQSLVRGCLFHAGDLEQRVDRVMRAIRVIDTDADMELAGAKKWLAFLCASVGWHRLGSLVIIVTPDVWTARQAIAADELAAVHAEAAMGRWPWGAS